MSEETQRSDGAPDAPEAGGHTRQEFLKRGGAAAAAVAAGGAFAGLGANAKAARYQRNLRAKVSGTLNVRYWGQGPERIAWDNRIKYFSSKYPGVKVNSQLLQKNGYDESKCQKQVG